MIQNAKSVILEPFSRHEMKKDLKATIGKDEVSSSNLDSSSTKSLEPQRFEGFLLFVFGGVIPGFVTVLLPGQVRKMKRKTEKKKD